MLREHSTVQKSRRNRLRISFVTRTEKKLILSTPGVSQPKSPKCRNQVPYFRARTEKNDMYQDLALDPHAMLGQSKHYQERQ